MCWYEPSRARLGGAAICSDKHQPRCTRNPGTVAAWAPFPDQVGLSKPRFPETMCSFPADTKPVLSLGLSGSIPKISGDWESADGWVKGFRSLPGRVMGSTPSRSVQLLLKLRGEDPASWEQLMQQNPGGLLVAEAREYGR